MFSQNKKLSVQIPLPILFLFYSRPIWAKLCLLYLSRALVKSLGSSFLEYKNTELSSRQRLWSEHQSHEMLEELICICW